MTRSRSIARVFFIINLIFLIPTTITMIPVVLYFVILTSSGETEIAMLFLLAIIVYVLGVILLIGYSRHSRGVLNNGKILPLWSGTVFLNLTLLAPTIHSIYFLDEPLEIVALTQTVYGAIYFSTIIWHILAVLLPISAIWDELTINRNIGNVP